jgi:hypothetical protein
MRATKDAHMPVQWKSGFIVRAGNKSSGLISQATEVINLVNKGRSWYNDHIRWTVSISQGDRLYDVAHRWFTDDFSDRQPPRALSARYGRKRKHVEDEDGYTRWVVDKDAPPIALYYDERGERSINIDGHRITVTLKKHDGDPEPSGTYRPPQPETIYFYARSHEGQVAVLKLLEQLACDQEKRKPALHLLDSWGDWSKRDDLPERPLQSVILKSGQMERLRDDMQNFLNQEAEYVRRGIPYHRGYMLYGPPGTGKTSIARALAAHFQLDLWYAPLGDLDKDTKLLGLINRVRPGSILLLEDIDVFNATHSREEEAGSVSMAGLLNALDGVATPHGLITIMTTNDISVIDDAILRAGRVDLKEFVGLPDTEQIGRMYNYWYNVQLPEADASYINWGGSTADLTEVFKRNLNDPQGALEELYKARP